jgi:hypothetical protein
LSRRHFDPAWSTPWPRDGTRQDIIFFGRQLMMSRSRTNNGPSL